MELPIELDRVEGRLAAYAQKPGVVTDVPGSTTLRILPTMTVAEGHWVLELEYFCVGGVSEVVAFPDSESAPQSSRDGAIQKKLPAMVHCEAFRSYIARLDGKDHGWPKQWRELRVALRLNPETRLQIRNVSLRLEKEGEFDAKPVRSLNAAEPQELEAYLDEKFSSQISKVIVEESEIEITGRVSEEQQNWLVGNIPMETLLGHESSYQTLSAIRIDQQRAFVIRVPRVVSHEGRCRDRLTDRWQLFRRDSDRLVAISHARYADEVACRSPHLPPAKEGSKKGLGGWSFTRSAELHNELNELGIAAVTVNLSGLHGLVSTTPQRDSTPFIYQGETYFINESRLTRFDETFREAKRRGVMVSAILLISNPAKSDDAEVKLLGHPNAVKDGVFAMPNVTSADGIRYYGAIISALADRWSHDDGVHGRVHHWIIHNEVDFGWIWTNAGVKTDIAYMDLYQRSMRLVHLIARQYDPHAQAFITLTHHWGDRGNEYGYGSKRMLELLVRFCEAEGNFHWGLAYHPYPQSLFNPRTWEDEQATFEFDTKKITPKNLEVLDTFMKLPALRYHGEVRPVHLSENGFNSKDYSAKSLEDQAAGMALAWKKISQLSSIKSWQYHNWIDNRHEGGLRIGLRKFPDDPDDPLGEKPIWNLYQALGTPQEDAIADPYLKTIGIGSWDEIRYTGIIESKTQDSDN